MPIDKGYRNEAVQKSSRCVSNIPFYENKCVKKSSKSKKNWNALYEAETKIKPQ